MEETGEGGGINHNVSSESPLMDAALLVAGFILVVLFAYWLLGWAIHFVVPWVPYSWETTLGEPFRGSALVNDDRESSVKAILARLEAALPESRPPCSLDIVRDSTVNVLAYPGRHILVYSGFLSEVESENEIAMILAHELGHYEKRHHLRSLGRALLPALVLGLVVGPGSDASALLGTTTDLASLHFSREQEAEADEVGLNLLVKSYGHAGGATDFFRRHMGGEWDPGRMAFLTTHPADDDRIRRIEDSIRQRNLPVQGVTKWKH